VHDHLEVVLVFDLFAPGVHHGQQGHAPFPGGAGYGPHVRQHFPFAAVADVDVDGDGVRSQDQGLFHAAYQDLGVGMGREAAGGGQVNDEPHVPAPAAMAAGHQALVHQDGVGPTGGHRVDGGLHIYKAVDGTHGHPMVHGDDDAAPGIPVHNAFHANLFADHFLPPSMAASPPARPDCNKK